MVDSNENNGDVRYQPVRDRAPGPFYECWAKPT